MRTYAFVNNKGGVGKTTSAENVAYIFATIYKQRVLFVDADPQGNSTRDLLPFEEAEMGVADLLKDRNEEPSQCIYTTDIPGLDIIPATDGLAQYEMEMLISRKTPDFEAVTALLEYIAGEDLYDICIIDCPPSYSSISCINAIAAAEGIIIPTDASCYSAVGMSKLVRQIDSLRGIIPNVRVVGALVTMWHNCAVVQDAEQYIREAAPIPVFQTVIRRTDKVLESTWAGRTAQEWSPFSSAARDYRQFVAELMAKEGLSCGTV